MTPRTLILRHELPRGVILVIRIRGESYLYLGKMVGESLAARRQ